MIILVGVVRQNPVDAAARHLQEGMIDVANMTPIHERLGKLLGQAKPLVQLPKWQKPRITGDLSRRRLDHNGLGGEEIKTDLKIRLRIHGVPPCARAG